jgi:hypothetical protein
VLLVTILSSFCSYVSPLNQTVPKARPPELKRFLVRV